MFEFIGGLIFGPRKTQKPWKKWTRGDRVIGTFRGFYEDLTGKMCPVIYVVEALFFWDGQEEFLNTDLVLEYDPILEKALKSVNFGTLISIKYSGNSNMQVGRFAGKKAAIFDVHEVEPTGTLPRFIYHLKQQFFKQIYGDKNEHSSGQQG